ncbi:hypothetical protein QT381_00050 [Galbitalea sp. SE-J8]|uniref:hypothetical protein n=1 Tax=Galbitalea sp. SE-J8 TaxID=3054952 RepID=UPI00259CAF69|nr:hypothetical protein [Galbitalea sp. SE-J8]MDM4761398.1 hypothetical protein [Galbitalea sp. SE-J8]
MTRTAPIRSAAVALGALSLAGTLAGCATAVAGGSGPDTGGTAGTAETGGAAGTGASGSYRDGEYTADGSYQSPGGTETITVDLTLADGVVSAVTVTGEPSTPDAEHYQGQFEAGIDALVVGKSLDDIAVSKVAGSSLTSGGFDAAIDDIKTQAAA